MFDEVINLIDDIFSSHTYKNIQRGSTEFAGPQSHVLQHIPLTVVERGNCTIKQICSFGGIGRDTCQSGMHT